MAPAVSARRVLLLRPAAAARPHVEALAALGIHADPVAVQELVWLAAGQEALRAAVVANAPQGREPVGMFLASHAAVRAFAEAVQQVAETAPLRSWHIVTAGPATLAALQGACAREARLARCVASATFASDAASAPIAAAAAVRFATAAVTHVVAPRTGRGRADIFEELTLRGISYQAIDCYEQRARSDQQVQAAVAALARGDYAAVVAFSPSSAEALATQAGPAARACAWIAIGPTTRQALRALGLPDARCFVAEAPTPAAIARAVNAALA